MSRVRSRSGGDKFPHAGDDVGDVIAGLIDGSGGTRRILRQIRLSWSAAIRCGDLPAFTDYSMSNRTYRYFKGDVMYPFGFGLSYSRFSYGAPRASSTAIHAGDSVRVTAEVRNAGPRDGDEVVELYVKPPQTAISPRVELEGFERIHLRAGEARRVEFTLTPRQLSEVDEKGNRAVLPGNYAISIAGGQPSLNTPDVALHIAGTTTLPR